MNPAASWDMLLYSMRHPAVKKGLTAAAVLSVLVLSVGLIYWLPAVRAHDALVGAVEAKRRAAVDAMHASELARAVQQASEAVKTLEKKLDAAPRQSELVDRMGRLARKRNVKILSESYEEGKRRGDYLPLVLDLSIQGGYGAVREFLHDIPGLPAWIEVQELRLERARETPGLVRAQIRLLAFRKVSERAPSS
jgi:Tfp pilus assembly protein PilO